MKISNRDLVLVVFAIFMVAVGGVAFFTAGEEQCVQEDYSYGIASGGISMGECCDGLVPKAVPGYVGGMVCMRPECQVECLQGVNGEGWYDLCTKKILRKDDCYTTPPPPCTPEGGMNAFGEPPCCTGLIKIGNSFWTEEGCMAPLDGSAFCTKCGDGTCKSPENCCNCPTDCGVCEGGQCQHDKDCGAMQFCEYPKGACAGYGTCMDKPTICPYLWQPVCGCDYETYANDCVRQMAGISKLHEWSCELREHPDHNYCNQGFSISEFSTGVPVANMWIHLPYQPKVADRMICTNSDGEAYTPILKGSFVKVILEPHEGDECVGGCEWEYIACEKPVLVFKVEEKK